MSNLYLVPKTILLKEDKPRPLTDIERARLRGGDATAEQLSALARNRGKSFEPRKKSRDKVVRVVEFVRYDTPDDAA